MTCNDSSPVGLHLGFGKGGGEQSGDDVGLPRWKGFSGNLALRTRVFVSGVWFSVGIVLVLVYFSVESMLSSFGKSCHGCESQSEIGMQTSWWKAAGRSSLGLGAISLCLSVLPLDRIAVRVCSCVVVFSEIGLAVYVIFTVMERRTHSTAWTHLVVNICETLYAVILVCDSAWLVHEIMTLHPRMLLWRIWQNLAVAFGMWPILCAIPFILFLYLSDPNNMCALAFTGFFFGAISYFCVTKKIRAMAQGKVASMAGITRSALGVAGLLGKGDVGDIMEDVAKMFCCVSCDTLKMEHFEDNKPDPKLRELTKPAAIGGVDGFLSHSWHDDPGVRWSAIQVWRDEFKGKNNGQEPTIWIDKFCIDQNNIEANLRCLPVFVSGCREVVVAFGPTYFQRLWCIMEIFVFLVMDTRNSRITVYGNLKMSDLAGFNPMEAKCYRSSDKERLLSVIEFGFGTMEEFRAAVVLEMKDNVLRGSEPSSLGRLDVDLNLSRDTSRESATNGDAHSEQSVESSESSESETLDI